MVGCDQPRSPLDALSGLPLVDTSSWCPCRVHRQGASRVLRELWVLRDQLLLAPSAHLGTWLFSGPRGTLGTRRLTALGSERPLPDLALLESSGHSGYSGTNCSWPRAPPPEPGFPRALGEVVPEGRCHVAPRCPSLGTREPPDPISPTNSTNTESSGEYTLTD